MAEVMIRINRLSSRMAIMLCLSLHRTCGINFPRSGDWFFCGDGWFAENRVINLFFFELCALEKFTKVQSHEII